MKPYTAATVTALVMLGRTTCAQLADSTKPDPVPPAPSALARDVMTVFQNGQDGYHIFRIPAIIHAVNGDVLAFCEAREGGMPAPSTW